MIAIGTGIHNGNQSASAVVPHGPSRRSLDFGHPWLYATQAHGAVVRLTFKRLDQFDGRIEMHVQNIGSRRNFKNHIRGGFDTNEVPEPVGLDCRHLSHARRRVGGHGRQVLQQGGLRKGSQPLQ